MRLWRRARVESQRPSHFPQSETLVVRFGAVGAVCRSLQSVSEALSPQQPFAGQRLELVTCSKSRSDTPSTGPARRYGLPRPPRPSATPAPATAAPAGRHPPPLAGPADRGAPRRDAERACGECTRASGPGVADGTRPRPLGPKCALSRERGCSPRKRPWSWTTMRPCCSRAEPRLRRCAAISRGALAGRRDRSRRCGFDTCRSRASLRDAAGAGRRPE